MPDPPNPYADTQLLAGHTVIEFDAPLRGVEGNALVYRIIPG